MLIQAASATLRILLFRAGPEDFPYDPTPRLLLGCIGFGVLPYLLLLPMAGDKGPHVAGLLLQALFNLGVLALITRVTLRSANLANRFQQTFNTLVCASSALTLAALPAVARVLPVLEQWSEVIKADPEIAQHPERLPPMPAGPMLMLAGIGLWQLVLTAFVFYRAAGPRSLLLVGSFFLATFLLMAMLGGAR